MKTLPPFFVLFEPDRFYEINTSAHKSAYVFARLTSVANGDKGGYLQISSYM